MPILKDRDRRGQVYHHEAGRAELQRKMLGGAGSALTGRGFLKPLPPYTHTALSFLILSCGATQPPALDMGAWAQRTSLLSSDPWPSA